MPITPEENDKIQEELEQQIAESVQTPPQETPDKEVEDKQEPDNVEEPEPAWAQLGFKSLEAMVESYKNAQATIGKQGTELGELRKKVEAPPKVEKPEEEPYSEYDPYDPENVKYFNEKWAREALQKQKDEDAKAEADRKAEEQRLKMISSFVETHSDLSEQETIKVAEYARDNGIANLNHAYIVMNAEKPHSSEKDKSNLGQQIKDLPKTLTDTGTGGEREVSVSELSQDAWDNMPKAERERLLRQDA